VFSDHYCSQSPPWNIANILQKSCFYSTSKRQHFSPVASKGHWLSGFSLVSPRLLWVILAANCYHSQLTDLGLSWDENTLFYSKCGWVPDSVLNSAVSKWASPRQIDQNLYYHIYLPICTLNESYDWFTICWYRGLIPHFTPWTLWYLMVPGCNGAKVSVECKCFSPHSSDWSDYISFIHSRDMGVAGWAQHLLPIPSYPRTVEGQPYCCGSGVTCRPDRVRTADFLP